MYQATYYNTNILTIVSDALSVFAIITCMFLKVPQILNILGRQSSDGISLQGLLMEIFGYTVTGLYNYTNGFKITTYLEYPIIIVQLHIMLFLVLKFRNKLTDVLTILFITYYWFIVGFFMLDVLPKEYLSFMIPLCLPISGFAKLTYIIDIIKLGNADAISKVTWVISTLTNLVRVFTVYVDSADAKLLINFSVSTILSFSVLATVVKFQWKSDLSTSPKQKSAQLRSKKKQKNKKSN